MMRVFAVGLAVRLSFVVIGNAFDAISPRLKYTDVDYDVFSDAAALIVAGRSPYERATYRYAPLFAWLLVPDALLGTRSLGKVVFSVADAALGAWLARRTRLALAWALNPVAVGVCTRGSSDAIVVGIVAAALDRADRAWPAAAGALLGLGAYVKLYPIIHVPAFAWHFGGVRALVVCFAAFFVVVFFGGWAASTYPDYIPNAVLYHATRQDHRHNFSVFWLPIYLNDGLGVASLALHAVSQAACVAFLARPDLALCVFAQTLLFVAVNKVVTAQYFVWWLPFAILVVAQARDLRRLVPAVGAWIITLGLWLATAYALEFQGYPLHLELWFLSLAFFAANIALLVAVLRERTTAITMTATPPPSVDNVGRRRKVD